MPRPESGAALEPKSTFKQMSLSSTVCLLVTKEKEVMLKQKTSLNSSFVVQLLSI